MYFKSGGLWYKIFSFVLNKVFVAARKHNRQKNCFILYASDWTPLNSRVKIKKNVLNFFSTLCFIASIKNIKQNIRENVIQCWFYETIYFHSYLVQLWIIVEFKVYKL